MPLCNILLNPPDKKSLHEEFLQLQKCQICKKILDKIENILVNPVRQHKICCNSLGALREAAREGQNGVERCTDCARFIEARQAEKEEESVGASICSRCGEPFPSPNIPKVTLPCKHQFHIKCFRSFIESKTNGLLFLSYLEQEKSVEITNCPTPGCTFKWGNEEVIKVLTPQEVQEYTRKYKVRFEGSPCLIF